MCFCCCDLFCCDCLLVLLAVIFPPLPVCLKKGLCSCDLLINICLCCLGWVPGMIHAWYIILASPQRIIEDEERQIFIVTQPQVTSVIVNKHPNQTKIRFSHPEPFLESNNHHVNNNNNNNNSNNNPDSLLDSNNLSPLSHTPMVNPRANNNYIPSPLSRPENNYGTIDNDSQVLNDHSEPPSYENVMNETAKQFK
jgi:uncharacterized membrane protein YqaE (UPF0057 family)